MTCSRLFWESLSSRRFLVQLTRGAALVLLYDHLVGQGVKPRGSNERTFLSYALVFDKLRQQLLLQHPGARKLSDLLQSSHPSPQPSHTSARVNLLLTTTEIVKHQLSEPCVSWACEFQEPTPANDVLFDDHLPDVFSLPAKILAHNHPLVESGHIVLQVQGSARFPALRSCHSILISMPCVTSSVIYSS